METVFIAYKTDDQHSFKSRDIIGICKFKWQAYNICMKKSKKENKPLDAEQKANLSNLNQTQGYKGDGEFFIEQMKFNELI